VPILFILGLVDTAEGAAALVAAASTAIYTVVTTFLWFENRRTLRVLERQLLVLDRQLTQQAAFNRSLAYHEIVNSHRDLLRLLIETKVADTALVLEGETDPAKVKERLVATAMINHCQAMFVDSEAGIIDPQHWESFIRDARGMFQVPLVRERWQTARAYYPPKFRAFVDDVIGPEIFAASA
jgi:hypothetical protein